MKILYLGLEPPASTTDRTIVHCSLIQIVPRLSQDTLTAVSELENYTHLLFTSKTAVRLFLELCSCGRDLSQLKIYSIGVATARCLKEKGLRVDKTACNECSEGLIELFHGDDLEGAHLFWPHSALSRTVIPQYFQKRGVRLTECHLYDTIPIQPHPLPNLAEFDEIFFTSPSTVESFFSLFKEVPSKMRLQAIGPITRASLSNRINTEPVTAGMAHKGPTCRYCPDR